MNTLNTLNTSLQSVAKIAQFEGDKLTPYNDVAGNATDGVGHLIHKGPVTPEDRPITEAQSLSQFAEDLKTKAEVYVNKFVKVRLNQNQFDSLSSFTYNLGCGTLLNLLSETGLNQGKYMEVPPAMVEYCKAHVNGQLVVVPGLLRRRQWEAGLFSA